MKNLKRVFSMALAMIMLLGMMILPGAAADFADEDKIVNKEAVAITAGMGLFAGAEGKFMPEGTVTRAQMATIIVKMLNGSDVNADSFKGSGKFSDTADFEGGWAEGYINWCATLGVVAGYGDGTFKPGKEVTAAEAVTMILNALKVDAGEGTWPVTVMAKSEQIKLFEDLAAKPGSDAVLNRDQLAVVVLNGLNYSPDGANRYMVGDKTFDSAMDAYLFASSVGGTVETVSGGDSLSGSVYELKSATGTVVGNQATGLDYTLLSDGKQFAIDTDLDDIGHYVTVYYKETYESDDRPGTTYAVVDEAKYVTLTEEADTAKEYKAAFGKNYALATGGYQVTGSYEVAYQDMFRVEGYEAGAKAPAGTYMVYEGKICGYFAPVDVYAARVTMVGKTMDREYIMLSGVSGQIPNTEGDDMVVEYEGIAADDLVTYVRAQGIYVLTKMTEVTGELSRHSTDEEGRIVITVGGKAYTDFGTENNAFVDDVSLNTLAADIADVNYGQSYTFYLAPDGTVVCYEEQEGVGFSTDNTVYLLGSIGVVERDAYGKYNKNNYARGIDMNGDEVMLLLGTVRNTDKNGNGGTETVGSDAQVGAGFYNYKASTVKAEREYDIQLLEAFNTNSRSDKPYTVSYTSNSGWNFTGKLSTGGKTYNKTNNSRYLVLDDAELTDANEFTASLSVGSCSVWLDQGQRVDCIVAPQTNGTQHIEVCIILAQTESAASEMVYVSQYANESTGHIAEGYVFKAYNAKNGDERELMLDSGDALAPGFYTVSTDAEGINTLNFMPAYTGSNPATNDNADGYYYYNVFYDSTLTAYDGTTIWTDGIVNNEACSAAVNVVDARDEDQIAADGVPQITSLNDIIALWTSQPEVCVTLDICYYGLGNRVSAIFVRGVGEAVVNAADKDAMVYLMADPRSGAVQATVVAVSGDRKATLNVGDTIDLTPEQVSLLDCSGSCFDNTMCNGFFSIEGSSLDTIKLKHQRALDSKGKLADHNIITGWSDDDKVATYDYHTKQADCGYYCYSNTKLTYTEAAYYLDLSGADTKVVDLTGSGLGTLADLKAAVQAAVADPKTDNGYVVSYYIPDAGNTPAVIVVWAKDGNLTRADNPSQALWQAWPGQTVYLPKGRSVGSSAELDGGAVSRRGASAWSMDGSVNGYLQTTCAYIPEASKPGFYTVGEMADYSYITLTYVDVTEQTADDFADLPMASAFFHGDQLVSAAEVEAMFGTYSSVKYLAHTADGLTAVAITGADGMRGAAQLYDASGAMVAAGTFEAMMAQAADGGKVVICEDITVEDRITVSGKTVTVTDDGTARTITVASTNRLFHLDADGGLVMEGTASGGLTIEGTTSGRVGIMVNGELTMTGNITVKNYLCDNSGDTTGGSFIYNAGVGTTVLEGVTFTGNHSAKAGGVIYTAGTFTATDVTFTGNVTDTNGGAVFAAGGTATLNHVTASGNTANRGYDVYGYNDAHIIINGGSYTSGNATAATGAAVYISGTNLLTVDGAVTAQVNLQGSGSIVVKDTMSTQGVLNVWLASYKVGRVVLSGDADAISAAVTAGAITSTRAATQATPMKIGTDGKLVKK